MRDRGKAVICLILMALFNWGCQSSLDAALVFL
jgi:hypothetical protein